MDSFKKSFTTDARIFTNFWRLLENWLYQESMKSNTEGVRGEIFHNGSIDGQIYRNDFGPISIPDFLHSREEDGTTT